MIDELRRLLGEATPGPWTRPLDDEPRALAEANERDSLLALAEGGLAVMHREADAALIAALRNHAPSLLARLEAAEAVVGKAEEWRAAEDERVGFYGAINQERMTAARKALDTALAHYDAVRKETR